MSPGWVLRVALSLRPLPVRPPSGRVGHTFVCWCSPRLLCVAGMLQVYGLRPFRIPLRWDFQNISSTKENVYNGAS